MTLHELFWAFSRLMAGWGTPAIFCIAASVVRKFAEGLDAKGYTFRLVIIDQDSGEEIK